MPNLIKLQPLEEDERRRWPRYLVPPEEYLIAGVAVVSGEGRPRTLTGRVHDISEVGLSLLMPDDESCGELSERGLTLAVVLTLPSGVVKLRGEVAHCAAPGGQHGEDSYLFGVHIAEIDAEDHDRLIEYIGEWS